MQPHFFETCSYFIGRSIFFAEPICCSSWSFIHGSKKLPAKDTTAEFRTNGGHFQIQICLKATPNQCHKPLKAMAMELMTLSLSWHWQGNCLGLRFGKSLINKVVSVFGPQTKSTDFLLWMLVLSVTSLPKSTVPQKRFWKAVSNALFRLS